MHKNRTSPGFSCILPPDPTNQDSRDDETVEADGGCQLNTFINCKRAAYTKRDGLAFSGRIFRFMVINLFGKSMPRRFMPIDFNLTSSLMREDPTKSRQVPI